jgi:hypothetical protein
MWKTIFSFVFVVLLLCACDKNGKIKEAEKNEDIIDTELDLNSEAYLSEEEAYDANNINRKDIIGVWDKASSDGVWYEDMGRSYVFYQNGDYRETEGGASDEGKWQLNGNNLILIPTGGSTYNPEGIRTWQTNGVIIEFSISIIDENNIILDLKDHIVDNRSVFLDSGYREKILLRRVEAIEHSSYLKYNDKWW